MTPYFRCCPSCLVLPRGHPGADNPSRLLVVWLVFRNCHFFTCYFTDMATPTEVKSELKDVVTYTHNPSTVLAVSGKLPDFYTTDPDAWFLHVEAQFGLHSVCSDNRKYWHILASLDAQTATRATCATSPVAPCVKYMTLKSFLIKAFSLSRWERAERILNTTTLGDRKPMALFNHLLTTLGSFGPDILLQHVFL